jgi:GxxExxY protein
MQQLQFAKHLVPVFMRLCINSWAKEACERQVPVPIEYDGIKFDEGFRADIIIESKVILELKSVESVTKAHKKQVLTYLRLTGCKLGYLLNFGEDLMKDGITRIINGELK